MNHDQPYVFDVTENDALPLENKLKEGRPLRYLNINDVINNPQSFCLLRAQEGSLKEQLLSGGGVDLGVPHYNVRD